MCNYLVLSLVLLAAACGPPDVHSITTGPNIVRTPSGCARMLSDGRYINDKLGTACHFARFNGAKVCIPDGMPVIAGASCDPAGLPNGPARVQIDLSGGGCGTELSRFALSRDDDASPLACDDIKGRIREVVPERLADQRIYLGPDNAHCTPSILSATPAYPFVRLKVPEVLLYADDLPAEVCK